MLRAEETPVHGASGSDSSKGDSSLAQRMRRLKMLSPLQTHTLPSGVSPRPREASPRLALGRADVASLNPSEPPFVVLSAPPQATSAKSDLNHPAVAGASSVPQQQRQLPGAKPNMRYPTAMAIAPPATNARHSQPVGESQVGRLTAHAATEQQTELVPRPSDRSVLRPRGGHGQVLGLTHSHAVVDDATGALVEAPLLVSGLSASTSPALPELPDEPVRLTDGGEFPVALVTAPPAPPSVECSRGPPTSSETAVMSIISERPFIAFICRIKAARVRARLHSLLVAARRISGAMSSAHVAATDCRRLSEQCMFLRGEAAAASKRGINVAVETVPTHADLGFRAAALASAAVAAAWRGPEFRAPDAPLVLSLSPKRGGHGAFPASPSPAQLSHSGGRGFTPPLNRSGVSWPLTFTAAPAADTSADTAPVTAGATAVRSDWSLRPMLAVVALALLPALRVCVLSDLLSMDAAGDAIVDLEATWPLRRQCMAALEAWATKVGSLLQLLRAAAAVVTEQCAFVRGSGYGRAPAAVERWAADAPAVRASLIAAESQWGSLQSSLHALRAKHAAQRVLVAVDGGAASPASFALFSPALLVWTCEEVTCVQVRSPSKLYCVSHEPPITVPHFCRCLLTLRRSQLLSAFRHRCSRARTFASAPATRITSPCCRQVRLHLTTRPRTHSSACLVPRPVSSKLSSLHSSLPTWRSSITHRQDLSISCPHPTHLPQQAAAALWGLRKAAVTT